MSNINFNELEALESEYTALMNKSICGKTADEINALRIEAEKKGLELAKKLLKQLRAEIQDADVRIRLINICSAAETACSSSIRELS